MSIAKASRPAILIFLSLLTWTAASRGAWASSEVHQRVAPATVLIFAAREGSVSRGSGVLVDHSLRLVLTAAHVVADAKEVGAIFPELSGGHVMTSLDHYARDADKHVIEGEILAVDHSRDVALIRLHRVPKHVHAVTLAPASPSPGEQIFAIGNSSLDLGGLFGMVTGMTRNVYSRSWDEVTVIDSTIATNPGDSGGPVVNSKGELVGIVSMGTTGRELEKNNPLYAKQSLDLSIDISEIREFLAGVEMPDNMANTDDVVAGILSESDIAALNESFAAVEAVMRDNDCEDLDEFVNWGMENAPTDDSHSDEPRTSAAESDTVREGDIVSGGIVIPRGLMADAFYRSKKN